MKLLSHLKFGSHLICATKLLGTRASISTYKIGAVGGICFCIRESLQVSPVPKLICANNVNECLAVTLTIRSQFLYHIVGIYRPPDPASLNVFNDALLNNILAYFRLGKHVFLSGYLNVNMLATSYCKRILIDDTSQLRFYLSLISLSTHET